MIVWDEPIEFIWDQGNSSKNIVHGVINEEIEEVFFDSEKMLGPDIKHSQGEPRHIVIGRNKKRRWLYIVITVRSGKVRVISARYMHQKEVELYEKTN